MPDIPSIFTGGASPEEALQMAKEAIAGYLEIFAEDDLPIPEPRSFYTEELAVRFPKDLHRALIKEAERKEVSINELITSLLNWSLAEVRSVGASKYRIKSGGKNIAEDERE